MRHSTIFFCIVALNILILGVMTVHALRVRAAMIPELTRTAEMVRELELTDLCLFTEASYTRHLSQTDLRTPFQDHPLAFEHFPTGSLTAPPAHSLHGSNTHD